MDLDVTTPAQERLRDELLGWHAPRPPADHELRNELRARIEDGIAPVLDLVPDGELLFVSKSRLDALACDGRFLDALVDDFSWNVNVARGKLAHRAIEFDWRTGRGYSAPAIVEHAWQAFIREGNGLGEYLSELQGVEAAQLHTDAEYLVNEFRDTWPSIPEAATIRLETSMQVTFGQPRSVKVSGTPDLLLGGVHRDELRMLLVDFKTGMRKEDLERQEMRFYALLSTLKSGVPPFRWAIYYVTEGAWIVEDYDPNLLRTAADRLVDGVLRIGRLSYRTPPEDQLRLRAGAYCNWCGRRETCGEYAQSRARLAAEG